MVFNTFCVLHMLLCLRETSAGKTVPLPGPGGGQHCSTGEWWHLLFSVSDQGPFVRIWIRLFFLNPDRIGQQIRIRSGKSGFGSMKKHLKTVGTGRKKNCISNLALSTLSFLVRFLQKLNKEHPSKSL